MYRVVAALMLAQVPPQFPAPPQFPPAHRPATSIVVPAAPAPQRPPAAFVNVTKAVHVAVPRGDHVHHCPCGNEWSHSTGNPGHVCQACGRVVTVINRWGPTTITKTVTERVPVRTPETPAVQPTTAPRLAATVGAWVYPSAASYPTQPNCPT